MFKGNTSKVHQVKGTVVLMSKNALDFNKDGATAIFSPDFSIKLISSNRVDGHKNGKVGKETSRDKNQPASSLPTLGEGKTAFNISFKLDESFGIPGAFYIKNLKQPEFFLVTLTLDIPDHGTIHFVCNSWVYKAQKDRIFFANKTYLPDTTPTAFKKYREDELKSLRGEGKEKGKRQEHERIYDYDVYNDLGNPDKSDDLARPVLGDSSAYPYPRRGRTGRDKTKKDPKSETPASGDTYIPRDEKIGHLKSSDFLTNGIKSLAQNVLPQFQSAIALDPEFDNFNDVRGLFKDGLPLLTDAIRTISQTPVIKEIFQIDGEKVKFPPPHVIQNGESWMTDEEFGREMLAGVHPCRIQRLQEFPPTSKLDASVYGDQTSKITKKNLQINLGKLTVEKALKDNRLFILDYHDAFLPFLRKINGLPNTKCYATRTILFLKDDGTLKPLAIELSLPHAEGDRCGANSRVILPAHQGAERTIWQLSKAYVVVNDSCYHQLVSHWLNTHAIMEPFVIATNRHLSVLHPIHKLLSPHYRDTMNVNGVARQSLINAGGLIEQSFLPGKYALEMSSAAYKNWVFTDQALPEDLVKRGMAVKDSSNLLQLVIKDYPYAVDGLKIWSAILNWVTKYVSFYYSDRVGEDRELESWWKEVVKEGHGDLKDKPWWPTKLNTRQNLIHICSTIIWIASAQHAAVNFGQYPYGDHILNRPTLTRRLIPDPGTKEYNELSTNHEKAYLKTITKKHEALVNLSVIAILSRHASDEVYLGQRDNPNWTDDEKVLKAFKHFGGELKKIENEILERNNNSSLRNRVKMPYTVLLPTSEEGLTFRGIPNSISI
ncbi:hypothetical protein PHAVU_010G135000 [Phaseolus vulgaris]|uniref:Lipoxygenase n=1 Tax=Phaseolus vulgaris TaxID=3885 RepID=V7ATG3_PHAVU|nr:hypothetical protein PHAVU_010G135000g [Phaseolus vulgaris]ESW07501.1 hypothetical protein PHAVU_010G135000g [Phaseolus vulgaris]